MIHRHMLQAVLCDLKGSRLDSLHVRAGQVEPGAELESDRYLIQVEERVSASSNTGSN